MQDTPNKYTELLLDFGLEGLIALKWCNNQKGGYPFLPKELYSFFDANSLGKVKLLIKEGFGIEIVLNLIQNGRHF